MHYQHKNSGTCSTSVAFDLTDGVVSGVRFQNGCDGNLRAVGKLVEGRRAQEIISLLKGNPCGCKNTSCADQLARALERAVAASEK